MRVATASASLTWKKASHETDAFIAVMRARSTTRAVQAANTPAAPATAESGDLIDPQAENRVPILAYHFAWPGIGNVGKQGEGFRYYPTAGQLQ